MVLLILGTPRFLLSRRRCKRPERQIFEKASQDPYAKVFSKVFRTEEGRNEGRRW